MQLYQEVVFSDELDWWSAEKMDYLTSLYHAQQDNLATPTPIEMDVNEYPYLAAYARYRIMLHHLVRGWVSEARTVYETLQAMFPPGAVGHEYAEMAARLWDEYQATNSLEQACAAVIAYVEDNQGILAPLGDKEHGLQSHIYEPADVCPFPWPPIGQ
ncbi:MAG: hypothetical protein OEV06_12660 [Anaerolineae bacterium]|nr:hypothetical protein [Anaerolineae bacterium]